jgi:RNA recognition motif-containing protein
LFGKIGQVISAGVKYDRAGRSLGIADVVMANKDDALRAIQEYDGVNLDDQPMRVTLISNTGTYQLYSTPPVAITASHSHMDSIVVVL